MKYDKINTLLNNLLSEKDEFKIIDIGINLSNEILILLGAPLNELKYGEDAKDAAFSNSRFKNQKMETWFSKHPYLSQARVAIDLFNSNSIPIKSNFFKLSDSSNKAKISASTQLDDNWEDNELTRKPQYKVGIDFFIKHEENSLLVVVTNRGNLRVLELSEKLSNTQIEIFDNISNCFKFTGIDPKTGVRDEFEPQRTIHKNLWDALALQSVNKKFYTGIAENFQVLVQHIESNLPVGLKHLESSNDIKLFSTRLLGRLLFLWFLKKKHIINKEIGYFDLGNLNSSDYYDRKLKVLFFQTLNTPIKDRTNVDLKTPYLNGGLFDPHPNDWAEYKVSFPITWFKELYDHFNSFNFTTDESSADYEQIAIDPEMLGRVFENLLATIVPETSKAASEKKNKGAFYTPREIVDYMTKQSIIYYLNNYLHTEDDKGIESLINMNDAEYLDRKSTGTADLWGIKSNDTRSKIIEALDNIKILDPACGSGAFPMGLLQLIVKTFDRLGAFYDETLKAHRLIKPYEKNNTYQTKLRIIQHSIYGVDIEPMAAEISRLRSWLSLVLNDEGDIEPLPNLDFNFVCANSLVPLKKGSIEITFNELEYDETFERIKSKYFNAHSKFEKENIKNEWKFMYSLISNDFDITERTRMLLTWNPFDVNINADFFDSKIMFNIEKFDLVIGNPPYIHFEDIKKDSKEIYSKLDYKTYSARGDIYTLFYEMGLDNLNTNGILCYITSNKWMRAGYGESLRNYFIDYIQPLNLIDLGSGVFDSATVDTNILIIEKSKYSIDTNVVQINKEAREQGIFNFQENSSLNVKFLRNQPWVILNKIEISIKSKIEKFGIPLHQINSIKINRGILTGLNEAFIVDETTRKEILNNCTSSEEYLKTNNILKPVIRGKDIKNKQYEWGNIYLIVSHNGYITDNGDRIKKIDIEEYPIIKKHLDKFNQKLKSRFDQGDTIYNLRNCAYMQDFEKNKIIFPAIMSKDSYFAYSTMGEILIAPGNIIVGDNLEPLLEYLTSIGYFALRKFYMGGGIEGELKVNRLLDLPCPVFLEKSVNKKKLFEYFHLSVDEVNYINDYFNEIRGTNV